MAIRVTLPTPWAQTLIDTLEKKMGIKPVVIQTLEGGQSEVYYGGMNGPQTILDIENHALHAIRANYSVKKY